MRHVWFSARYMCFCGTGARGVGRVWGPGFWRLLRLLFGVLSWRFLQIRLLLDQREEHEQDHADHVLTSTTSLIHFLKPNVSTLKKPFGVNTLKKSKQSLNYTWAQLHNTLQENICTVSANTHTSVFITYNLIQQSFLTIHDTGFDWIDLMQWNPHMHELNNDFCTDNSFHNWWILQHRMIQ